MPPQQNRPSLDSIFNTSPQGGSRPSLTDIFSNTTPPPAPKPFNAFESIGNFSKAILNPDLVKTQPTGPGVVDRVKSTIQESGKKVNDIYNDESKSPIRRGFEEGAAAGGGVTKALLYDTLPGVARQGIDYAGEKIGQGAGALTNKISDIPELQQWTVDHPEATKALEEILGTASAGGEVAGDILALGGAAETGNKIASASKKALVGETPTLKLDQVHVGMDDGSAPSDKVFSNKPSILGASDEQIVQDYMKKIQAGEDVGKVTIDMGDTVAGKRPVITDGTHRLEAYQRLGIQDIPAVDNTGTILKAGSEGARLGDVFKGPGAVASKVGEKILGTGETPEALTGKVLQGKTKDIARGKSGIGILDTSKVKTYKDLSSTADSKIGELAKSQDEILGQDPTPRPLESFTKVTGEGENSVKLNYVEQALDNLQELYANTSDAKGLSKLKGLATKAKEEGLTIKEVNDLARTYGSEFGSKAFGKTGEALTSVNAQKFENIRTGLKNTARELLPDEASRTLDKQMTDLYTVKDLSTKMAEKVNTLTQRLQQTNILQKIGGLVGKATRITGVGDFAAKLLGIDKVPGAATLNAVELEKQLSRNLGKINAALAKDDTGFIKDITDIAKSNLGHD